MNETTSVTLGLSYHLWLLLQLFDVDLSSEASPSSGTWINYIIGAWSFISYLESWNLLLLYEICFPCNQSLSVIQNNNQRLFAIQATDFMSTEIRYILHQLYVKTNCTWSLFRILACLPFALVVLVEVVGGGVLKVHSTWDCILMNIMSISGFLPVCCYIDTAKKFSRKRC